MVVLIKEECNRCQGSGEYIKFEDSNQTITETCSNCNGTGKIVFAGFSLKALSDKLDAIEAKIDELLST